MQEKNIELERYNNHLEDIVREKSADIIDMNERLNAVISNCADGILLISHLGEVIHANPASETVFGLDLGIIHTKSVFDLFISNEINWQSVFSKKEELLLRDIEIINAVNGNKIPVEISCAFIPPKDETQDGKYVLVIRNVSYQKEMERLREDFIATLTHDLRTPALAAIQTLEYFLNGKLGQLTDKQNMLLATMKKSNEDMLGLVNTLLEVYKYEAGRLKPVITAFPFEPLINECISQIEPISSKKNQKIEKTFVNLDYADICADRNELRRVIVNLIGNAVKYTQEGGLIEIKAQIDGSDVRFSVKDNGEGIYKKDIPKLFKRFSQGTQEKRSISTGLGLYLSKQIIDAHGGKIWLESDKGKGSEFFFLLINAVNSKKEETLWTR